MFVHESVIEPTAEIGEGTEIYKPVNIYGCRIGKNCRIGPFVEIQKGVDIGDYVKIGSHTFICEGVLIGKETFVGHNVTFINDRYPFATTLNHELKQQKDWELEKTFIGMRVSIGSSATILCGVVVGQGAIIGAGSVVTKDVSPYTIVAGNPAQFVRYIK